MGITTDPTLKDLEKQRSPNAEHGFNGTLTRIVYEYCLGCGRSRDALDVDVDRLVLTTDVSPFTLVADARGLPAAAVALAIVAPLARHVEPVVISSYWVTPLQDEGSEFVPLLP